MSRIPPTPSLTCRSCWPRARSSRSIRFFMARTSDRLAPDAGAAGHRPRPVHERLAEPRIAGGEPGLDERLALPQGAAALVVLAVGGQGQGQGPGGALGTQAEVDPVRRPLLRHAGEP